MVGVNIVATLKDHRLLLEHILREREKFDSDNAHLNLTTRYFSPPASSTGRETA